MSYCGRQRVNEVSMHRFKKVERYFETIRKITKFLVKKFLEKTTKIMRTSKDERLLS